MNSDNHNFSRLALGTVQFGMNYGIANTKGQVNFEEISEILNFCQDINIKTLDTAVGYGDSEKYLGNVGVKNFEIITKIPALPKGCNDIDKWINDTVNGSMSRLNVSYLDVVLFHVPNQLLDENGSLLYTGLTKLKNSGKISKIGISVYEPGDLDKILKLYKFDIVQLPYNILDRRFEKTNWLKKLKNLGIEIHVRSIFLQGLLLMKSEDRPKYFSKWNKLLKSYDYWLSVNKISPIKACLNHALAISEIDKIVFGVDSLLNLKEIVSTIDGNFQVAPGYLCTDDVKIINPSLWPKP